MKSARESRFATAGHVDTVGSSSGLRRTNGRGVGGARWFLLACLAVAPVPGQSEPRGPSSETHPTVATDEERMAALVQRGRSQYRAGEREAAAETFRRLEELAPGHPDARHFLLRLAEERAVEAAAERDRVHAQMLEEVGQAWRRPTLHSDRRRGTALDGEGAPPLARRLAAIIIPRVSFSGIELSKAIATLSAISEEFDRGEAEPRGVNIVVLDPTAKDPPVNLTLRNLSLKRILDFVTDAVGYQYEVQADAVVVRPGGETSVLDTAFFPVTRSTVLRMTGLGTPATGSEGPAPTGSEASALQGFLQQAGINFDAVPGSSLAYDGSALIVTQTARNLERIRNILNRYNDVRQVEIEAKFMEVREGALEELGWTWGTSRRALPQFHPETGAPLVDSSGRPVMSPREVYSTAGGTRSLMRAFTHAGGNGALTITPSGGSGLSVPVMPPGVPGSVPLGPADAALATISGVVGEFEVNAVLRALSQKAGTDLLSAPKVTVLSGNPATITVAQELRYPQSYGETQSQVGTGNSAGGGAAGVAITAGTPRDFTSRNIGVELKVTPTVEEDDYSISLDLHPKVTEFEGFVEYGGTSVAVTSGTSVSIPSGFFQPIFSVREVSTKVTLWDGATLVMGGLTREEIKMVNDKVPVLGDLPVLGRLFRSKGTSSEKRNLLIFVTANLVSPGGSPKKQALRNVPPSSAFENPTVVTPGGLERRHAAEPEEARP